MRRRGFLAGLGLMALAPAVLRAQGADPQALIAGAALGGTVAYAAIDTATGRLIAEHQADLLLPPASTLKSVTALYALDRLGAGHRFSTRVIRAGDLLVLVGGGDPVLDTDALDRLAMATAEAEKAAGRPPPLGFAVWGGALPRVPQLDPTQDDHLPYNPTISGLNLNFNRVHLDWRRGDKGYALSLQARGERLSPRAYGTTIALAERRLPLFTYDGSGKLESWTVARGALGKSGSRWLPVRRPELYAGDVFQTLCRARGLALPNPVVIELLPEGLPVASHDSPPLHDILRDMMEYSTNLTAEVVGLAASGAGSPRASAAAMADWLRAQGMTGNFGFDDHSGLSVGNRVTARLLAGIAAGPGQAAGLRRLMKTIPLRDARGRRRQSPIHIEAKTGTLNFVSNLSGYAQREAGPERAFAILSTDAPRRAASEGQELPEGVLAWTKRAKTLQQALIEDWCAPA